VGLHHDRAAGRERRDGVAAGDGERQREVRRAEHGDRSERHQHAAHVGLRQRLALGLGAVDPRLDPGAGLDEIGDTLEARL
jgi:hypothetical protein